MRLAIIADIHGNLPALEAALADIEGQSPDALLCLGDVAGMNAWPAECIQLLHAAGALSILGNADEDALNPKPFAPRGLFPDEREIYDLDEWGRQQLGEDELSLLRSYAPTVELPGLLAFHGSPENCRESIGERTSEERLDELRSCFGQQPSWVGGHTHTPLLRQLGGWRLLNPGSVGLTYERRGEQYVNLSRAEYLLLDGDDIQFRRVPYDVRAVQAGIRERGMPHADWWVGEWIQG